MLRVKVTLGEGLESSGRRVSRLNDRSCLELSLRPELKFKG